jgi:hypothetical protein
MGQSYGTVWVQEINSRQKAFKVRFQKNADFDDMIRLVNEANYVRTSTYIHVATFHSSKSEGIADLENAMPMNQSVSEYLPTNSYSTPLWFKTIPRKH